MASGVPTPAAGWATTTQTYSSANCGSQTSPLTTNYAGYDVYGNTVAMVDGVGAAHSSAYASVGCTLSTAPTIMSSSFGQSRYTSCASYDSLGALVISQTNALGQISTTAYDQTQRDQPTSVTDANGQTTTVAYSYDSNGNPTTQNKQPLETNSYSDQSTKVSNCTTSSILPCFETDAKNSLYSSAVTRTFYDSQGREVETRAPGPTSGDDTVTITVYNDQNHTIWESVAFQVADGSGWIDPNGATDINGNAPAGTVTFLDALDRTIAVQDPNYGSSLEPGTSCSTTLSGTYTSCTNYSVGSPESSTTVYETVSAFDANNHLSVSYIDALGRTAYTQQYSGTGPLVSTTALLYSGKATSSTSSDHAYMKVFDVSSLNITVSASTTLSYWIYPQSSASNSHVSGSNSTCIAIDMVFTNSTDLRDSGAVDQNGNQIHPAHQCGHLTLDTWNYVVSNIGAKVSGRTINRIDIGYDQPDVTGGYRGYVDDIKIYNPTSTTPLFATDLESGSTQPTWTNTVDTTSPGGNIVNIGGFSGSLTAPELGTRTELSHNGRVVKQTQMAYNALDESASITVKDYAAQAGESTTNVTTTMTYDDLGQLLTEVDPDQGTFTYSYDADGHVTSVVQTSGSSSRTLGYNYDLLGRMTCEQTAAPTFNATGACSAGNPLLVNTYDTTMLGTQGTSDFPIGHLTQSVATTYYADGTSAIVTQQYQTDQRGRATNEQILLTLPSGWNISTGLPLYQLAMASNDANQVTTITATAGTATYSFSSIYDATNGSLQGLSSGTSGSSANLASLAYNEYALLSGITLLNGSSTQVASTQYSYDGDQRLTSLTTNWLPGSGTSGEILGQSRTYDNASNVTSTNTFLASVPGQSSSGGTEVQNFCYNEQDQLIWAGNGGTQPGANKGTCGSGTLTSGLVGAGYTSPFAYTNLGQIWQGPLNGGSTTYQYLYCNSAPHQLSGVYPLGTTCSTKSSATAAYATGYDAWGNETSRTYNSTTATLSYDAFNRLTEYSVNSGNQEFYVYDGDGNRVLKRSISGGTTTLTAYAYGLQELTYTGAGVLTNQIDYYSVAGHFIGSTNGSTTTYDLTDAQGSVLTSISASAMLGEQTYGPYGNQRYLQGTIGTDKGYTGQFTDVVTGLDYYNARYYDPVAGRFLSADNVDGNAQGSDPYTYVSGNPTTLTDPTGHCGCASWWDVLVAKIGMAKASARLIWSLATGDTGGAISALGDYMHYASIGGFPANKLAQRQALQFALQRLPRSLPSWAWITIAVVLAVSGVTLATGGSSVRASKDQGSANGLRDASKRLADFGTKNNGKHFTPTEKNNFNFGGGQLSIRKGDSWINLGAAVFYTDNLGLGTPHVEQQVVTWADGKLRSSGSVGQIDEVYLVIYSRQKICSTCLGSFTAWEAQLALAAGVTDLDKVTITVYSSNPNGKGRGWGTPGKVR